MSRRPIHLSSRLMISPGSGGFFGLTLGERTLFSKEQADRFPNENEVENTLEEVLG